MRKRIKYATLIFCFALLLYPLELRAEELSSFSVEEVTTNDETELSYNYDELSNNTQINGNYEKDPAIQSSFDIETDISSEDNTLEKYIYYRQGDPAWSSSGLSMSSAGCGPTAVAVAISNLDPEKHVTPVDAAKWGKENGYYSGGGSSHGMIPAIGEHYGMKVSQLGKDINAVRDALKNGGMVIGLMGPGHFTNGGHFVVLLEIDNNDQVLVADVATKKRSQRYDLSYMIGQSKSAGAGGPFWAYFNNIEIPTDSTEKTEETTSTTQSDTNRTQETTKSSEETKSDNTNSSTINSNNNTTNNSDENKNSEGSLNINKKDEKLLPEAIVVDTKWKEQILESVVIKQTLLDKEGNVKTLNELPVYEYHAYHLNDEVKVNNTTGKIIKLTVFGAYLTDENGNPLSYKNNIRIPYINIRQKESFVYAK